MSVATTIRAVTTRTPLEKPTEAMIAPLPHRRPGSQDRKSTRLNSSHLVISYAVFCLKKKMFKVELGRSHYGQRARPCESLRQWRFRMHELQAGAVGAETAVPAPLLSCLPRVSDFPPQ